MSFFEPPQLIEAEVFASVPARLRRKGHPSTWIDANHPGSGLDCFLEGPAFDRDGNLYMVDIPYGRILRMSPRGEFDVAAEYEGWPDGLAMDEAGNLSAAHARPGIVWVFSSIGEPLYCVQAKTKGSRMTNIAYRHAAVVPCGGIQSLLKGG